MDTFWWWFIAAIVLIAIELATGTVYLLMLALGLAAGGLAAWMGYGFSIQLLATAILATVGCLAVRRQRGLTLKQTPSQRDENVQIDVGHQLTVDAWQANGTTTVQYRGAQWAAKLDEGQLEGKPGAHTIVALQGNTLVLKATSN